MTQEKMLARACFDSSPCFPLPKPGPRWRWKTLLALGFAMTCGLTCGHLQAQVTGAPPSAARAQSLPQAPLNASISGTVTDDQGDVIPGATVTLAGPDGKRSATTGEEGGFAFNDLRPGGPYRLKVECHGCISWASDAITLRPGQFLERDDIHLRLSGGTVSVIVTPKTELQIATEQVHAEEHQRVLGVVPNFYVTYSRHPVPLSAGLKYKLALKTLTDPVTVFGAAFMAGIDQAAATPDYGGGMEGYAKRFGNEYTTGFVDLMLGGAVFPALLHQDPRYFYQGTGTRGSRLRHAIASAFLCPGDNGKMQINYSSMGGDLAAGAISNLYYPPSDRGVTPVFVGFAVSTAGHIAVGIMQEFFLNRMTRREKTHN